MARTKAGLQQQALLAQKKRTHKERSPSSSSLSSVELPTTSKKRKYKRIIPPAGDSDSDYVVEKSEPKAKKIKKTETKSTSSKPTSSKSKKSKSTSSKSTSKSKSKNSKSTSTKSKKSTGKTKSKLVVPIDYESYDEDAIECTDANKFVIPGVLRQINLVEDKNDKMWVDKYKPSHLNGIVGQDTPKSCANKLKEWLLNWQKNKSIKPKFGSKNDKSGIGFRAALLSGFPGIGKTTTAQLVAKECGYKFIEFNASDTRNEKSMKMNIKALATSLNLDNFVVSGSKKKNLLTEGKNLIIMDEVDGMTASDRNGIGGLIEVIKKTKIPIICICNDSYSNKIRTLKSYCFHLSFPKPKTEKIKKFIKDVCDKEGIKINTDLVQETVESTQQDIRSTLNYFSVMMMNARNLNETDVKAIKDRSLNAYDSTYALFTDKEEYNSKSFNEKSNLFFTDYKLMPLFAWENYIQCKPTLDNCEISYAVQNLERACKSINNICIGDQIEAEISNNQNWKLLPVQGVMSCVAPGIHMRGHFGGLIEFPALLGKFSALNKKKRLTGEIKHHMNLKMSGSLDSLNLDYIMPIREKVMVPLETKEKTVAVNEVIEFLNHYDLLKDDLASIFELSLWDKEKSPYDKLPKEVKAALTRNFNSTIYLPPYSVRNMFQKKGSKAETKKKDEDEEKEDPIDEPNVPEF